MSKNIEITINNNGIYETLYPRTLASLINDILSVKKGGTGVNNLNSLKNNLNISTFCKEKTRMTGTSWNGSYIFPNIENMYNISFIVVNIYFNSFKVGTVNSSGEFYLSDRAGNSHLNLFTPIKDATITENRYWVLFQTENSYSDVVYGNSGGILRFYPNEHSLYFSMRYCSNFSGSLTITFIGYEIII